MTGWDTEFIDHFDAPIWLDGAKVTAEASRETFRRLYMAEWCSGRVTVNGHYLPCTKDRGHDEPCDVDDRTRAIRDHLVKPETICIRSGCPAYADDETPPDRH